MRTNFFGAAYLTHAVLPGMLARRRGWIVNVTSVAGYIPNPNESAYGATKAALSLWSHALAVDLHGTGVRARCHAVPSTPTSGRWTPCTTASATRRRSWRRGWSGW
jgi:short-subunit dehydrogenase